MFEAAFALLESLFLLAAVSIAKSKEKQHFVKSPHEDVHGVVQNIPRCICNNFPSLLWYSTWPISSSVFSDLHHNSVLH